MKPGDTAAPRPTPRSHDLNVNFIDDEDLQAALARSRRAKLKKPKKVSPEELAQQGKLPFTKTVERKWALMHFVMYSCQRGRAGQER